MPESEHMILECSKCQHQWVEHIELPMEVGAFVARAKGFCVCPACGVDKGVMMLVGERYRQACKDLGLVKPLTNTELKILTYIARGLLNKDIAKAMKISEQTVKNHLYSIYAKLNVTTRTQAVMVAFDNRDAGLFEARELLKKALRELKIHTTEHDTGMLEQERQIEEFLAKEA